MLFYTPKTRLFSIKGLWQELWSMVWNLSEFTGVSLGRYAPWVFEQMIGCKREKIGIISK